MAVTCQVWQSLDGVFAALGDPELLRPRIEFLALRHMNLQIEADDLEAFKILLVDMANSHLGTSEAFQGAGEVLDAVGRSMIATRKHYSGRIRVLLKSWKGIRVAGQDSSPTNPLDSTSFEEDKPEKSFKDLERSPTLIDPKTMDVKKAEGFMPSTFEEMAHFNASVMGLGSPSWLSDFVPWSCMLCDGWCVLMCDCIRRYTNKHLCV